MITLDEAQRIAQTWVSESAPVGTSLTPMVREFDLGYVVWGKQAPDEPPLIGAGRGVIDKNTGEMSLWPSLPVDLVITQYRERQAVRTPTQWTWDPAEQARWDLQHVVTPTTISHLRLADRLVISRSVKGDEPPRHHSLVSEFFRADLELEYRERGHDRCAEAAALSDALHADDGRRRSAGDPPITLEEARTGLFAGAKMTTYRVRESGDPVAGSTGPPCLSCAVLLGHFGFQSVPPGGLADPGPDGA